MIKYIYLFGETHSIFSLNHFLSRRYHKVVPHVSDCSIPLFKLQIVCPFGMESDGKFCLHSHGALLSSLQGPESYHFPESLPQSHDSESTPLEVVLSPLVILEFLLWNFPSSVMFSLKSKHHSMECANGFQSDSPFFF